MPSLAYPYTNQNVLDADSRGTSRQVVGVMELVRGVIDATDRQTDRQQHGCEERKSKPLLQKWGLSCPVLRIGELWQQEAAARPVETGHVTTSAP